MDLPWRGKNVYTLEHTVSTRNVPILGLNQSNAHLGVDAARLTHTPLKQQKDDNENTPCWSQLLPYED